MTGANLVQSQAMKLSLSAGMRQSLQVLQCSSEDLTSLIYEQLWNNPMLEEAAGGNDLSGFDGYFDRRDPGGRTRTAGFEEWGAQSGPGDSLEAVLTEQLNFSVDRRSVLYRAAAFIIGNLTDAGYLTMTVADMAHALRMPETEVEKALVAVRSFEPAGVGAYGLRDCLLLQLGRLEQRNELAERLVESCLTDLSEGNIGKIAAKLKEPAERLRDAIRLVRGLDPRPGARFARERTSYIVPDAVIVRRQTGYAVYLHAGAYPRLVIADGYASMLRTNGVSRSVRTYLQERRRAAAQFIGSIEQREQTLLRVIGEIVVRQEEFLGRGPGHLRPLSLQDIARSLELHESTVSRAVQSKYVLTDRGVLALKSFFSSSLRSISGESSQDAVKGKIKRLIGCEDRNKPLSDQALSDLLALEGIAVARRTVAKYREELGIGKTSQRQHLRGG